MIWTKLRAKRRFCLCWRRWLRPALFFAAVIYPFQSSIASWNWVPTGSMKPTILEGDWVFTNKLAYDLKVPFTSWHLAKWADPKRGDVVLCYSPYDGVLLVKRVVGVPGDLLAMQDYRLSVNGQPAAYSSLSPSATVDMSQPDKSSARFARENLDGRTHAVMIQPGLPSPRTFGPLRVPVGSYFVLGDNRTNSFDSRYIGFIPRDQIVGEAKGVIISVDLEHWLLPRFDRFLHKLD